MRSSAALGYVFRELRASSGSAAVVKKRAHLIRLGLAQRKPGKRGAAEDGESPTDPT